MATDFGSVPGGESSINEFSKYIKNLFDIGAEDFASAIGRLTQGAVEVNKTFTQGRQRIIELQQSLADTVPGVNRLGGQLSDVTNIISEVAQASKRNVISTSEEVEKLYAAQKVLGIGADELTNSFLDVGMSVSKIGESLEGSIKYVQSIGGNASQVVKEMRVNMDQLNRYQFEGGVQGLTKMAAQASMLRFDMSNTFALAEKVLSPEGAIETASAFQRLGVAAGNLVDPFQLMNQSINDPSGLQDSLARVSKQYTYFDEKTKTFKINPQGVLTLRELEKEAGLAQGSLSKMGLAAADLDRRLSTINRAGLSIGSEEDKQFLANIATMTKEGTYEVKVKDEQTGKLITKELSEVTQSEFNKLIEEQKKGPQTLEEMTRSQMGIQEIMQNDLSAIRNKVVGGIATPTQLLGGLEGARRLTEVIGGELSKAGATQGVRGKMEDFITGTGNLLKDLADPAQKDKLKVLSQYANKFGDELQNMQGSLTNLLSETAKKAEAKISDETALERGAKKFLSKLPTPEARPIEPKTTEPARAQQIQEQIKPIVQQYGGVSSSKIEMGGKIVIDVNIQGNQSFTPEQRQELAKSLTEKFRELGIQNYMVNVTSPQNPTKAPK